MGVDWGVARSVAAGLILAALLVAAVGLLAGGARRG